MNSGVGSLCVAPKYVSRCAMSASVNKKNSSKKTLGQIGFQSAKAWGGGGGSVRCRIAGQSFA